MNARIKFSKYGVLKFLGHLDLIRYFQKAIRRSGIDIIYTKGFNPHQIMTFASPISLGYTSDGEYMDIELNTYKDADIMISHLNSVMTEGILVTGFYQLPDWELNKKKQTAMSLVTAADYKVSFKLNNIIDKEEFQKAFLSFIKQEHIVIIKKSKKSENEIDIKPYIYHYAFNKEIFIDITNQSIEWIEDAEKHADVYGLAEIYMRLAAGSVVNIKPEFVLDALFKYIQKDLPEHSIQIHRMDLYQTTLKNNKELLIPLSETAAFIQ